MIDDPTKTQPARGPAWDPGMTSQEVHDLCGRVPDLLDEADSEARADCDGHTVERHLPRLRPVIDGEEADLLTELLRRVRQKAGTEMATGLETFREPPRDGHGAHSAQKEAR